MRWSFVCSAAAVTPFCATAAALANPPLTTVALQGTSGPYGPGVSGATFSDLRRPVVNSSGAVAFMGTMAGTTTATRHGLWVAATPGGALNMFAREGDAAGGVGPGVTYLSLIDSTVNIADNGLLAFYGAITGDGVTSANSSGLFIGFPAAVQMAVRSGDQAPGTTAGATFTATSSLTPALTSFGTTAFRQWLTGTGVTPVNDNGLWLGGAGALQLVAREGNSAPGFAATIKYGGINGPSLNEAGACVFHSSLTGPGSPGSAIFRRTSPTAATQSVVSPGSAIAGGGGLTIAAFGTSGIGEPKIDAGNNIIVDVTLAGPGVTTANDSAIVCIVGGSGLPVIWAREGDHVPGLAAGVVFTSNPLIYACDKDAADGRAVFRWNVTGPGITTSPPNNITICSVIAGQVGLIARSYSPAPGLPAGSNFAQTFTSPVINAQGQVAFRASATGPDGINGSTFGIWCGSAGHLTLVAKNGDSIFCGDGVTRTVTGLTFFPSSTGEESTKATGLGDNGWLTFRADFTGLPFGVFVTRVITPDGRADIGGPGGLSGPDGRRDNNDFIVFIDDFFAARNSADIGGPGGVEPGDGHFDNNDFVVFIDQFFTGTP
jgi:hypothetical protein